MSLIPRHCFRLYDIRGIADREFSDPGVEKLGQAIGTYLEEFAPGDSSLLTVGMDARLSSPRLKHALIRGLMQTGFTVIDLGVCPTPLLYFSLFHLSPRGGIMITGSHNPPEYNGFKICAGREAIYGEEIQKVSKILESGRFRKGEGKVINREIIPDYLNLLHQQFSFLTPRINEVGGFSVVVDSGNGTAGLVAPELMRRIGVQVIELYSHPDGNFPHHHPDPTIPANLTDLISEVKQRGVEVGFAYDGDADRLGVVDRRGNIIWGDVLMTLFSREILKEHPGAVIIGEVKCSQIMYEEIRRLGGRPIMGQTGHSLIKKRMKEAKALLAGGMSGHLFFADRYFGYDDAIYASLRLIELLVQSSESLEEQISRLPRLCSTPELRVDCQEEEKFLLVKHLEKAVSNREEMKKRFGLSLREVITVDGLRAGFEKGWALVRASNTQPVLVMRFEAENLDELKKIQKAFEVLVEEAKVKSGSSGERG